MIHYFTYTHFTFITYLWFCWFVLRLIIHSLALVNFYRYYHQKGLSILSPDSQLTTSEALCFNRRAPETLDTSSPQISRKCTIGGLFSGFPLSRRRPLLLPILLLLFRVYLAKRNPKRIPLLDLYDGRSTFATKRLCIETAKRTRTFIGMGK